MSYRESKPLVHNHQYTLNTGNPSCCRVHTLLPPIVPELKGALSTVCWCCWLCTVSDIYHHRRHRPVQSKWYSTRSSWLPPWSICCSGLRLSDSHTHIPPSHCYSRATWDSCSSPLPELGGHSLRERNTITLNKTTWLRQSAESLTSPTKLKETSNTANLVYIRSHTGTTEPI